MPVVLRSSSHAGELLSRLSALLSTSSLVDLEIRCESRIIAAHKLIMAAVSSFFASKLCEENVNVAVVVDLEDFDININHEALAFIVQFAYNGNVVIPDHLAEEVHKAVLALGIESLDQLLQQKRQRDCQQQEAQPPKPQQAAKPPQQQPQVQGQSQELVSEAGHQPHQAGQGKEGERTGERATWCIEIDGDLNVTHTKQPKHNRPSRPDVDQQQQKEQPPHHEQSDCQQGQQPQRRQLEQQHYQSQPELRAEQPYPLEQEPQARQFHYQPQLVQRQRQAFEEEEQRQQHVENFEHHIEQQEETQRRHRSSFGEHQQLSHSQEVEQQRQSYPSFPPQIQQQEEMEQHSMQEDHGHEQLAHQDRHPQHQPVQIQRHGAQSEERQIRNVQDSLLTQQRMYPEAVVNEMQLLEPEEQREGQPSLLHADSHTTHNVLAQTLQDLREQLTGDWSHQKTTVASSSSDMASSLPSASEQTASERLSGTTSVSSYSNFLPPSSFPSSMDLMATLNSSETTKGPSVVSEDAMLAIRSGVPIALQSRRRRRRDNDNAPGKRKSAANDSDRSKGDLGIRKDLTLPSARNGEDNVFQPENVMMSELSQFPVIHIDDNDSELDNPTDDIGLDEHSDNGLNLSPANEIVHNNDNEDNNETLNDETEHSENNVSFTCLECTMAFAKPDQLRMHVRHAHQKEETVFCPVCKQGGIKGKQDLKLHLYYAHAIGEIFRCDECGFETAIKGAYVRHKQRHSSSLSSSRVSFRCEECDKEFSSKKRYDNHVISHSLQAIFRCQYCEYSCTMRTGLVTHLAVKHQRDFDGNVIEPNFVCDVCRHKCYTANQLRAHHRRKHTRVGSMRYKCDQCDYATIEKGALVKHIRFKHTKEKPFKCPQCDYSACTQSSMLRHQRSHQRLKPYECNTCGQKFADKKRRDEHQRGHDLNAAHRKLVKCPLCPFNTARKDNLAAHIKRKHTSSQRDSDDINEMNKRRESNNDGNAIDRSHIVGLVKSDGSIRPVASRVGGSSSDDNSGNGRVRVEFIEASVSSTSTPTLSSSLSISTATVLNPDDPEANAEEIIVFQSNSDNVASQLTFS